MKMVVGICFDNCQYHFKYSNKKYCRTFEGLFLKLRIKIIIKTLVIFHFYTCRTLVLTALDEEEEDEEELPEATTPNPMVVVEAGGCDELALPLFASSLQADYTSMHTMRYEKSVHNLEAPL